MTIGLGLAIGKQTIFFLPLIAFCSFTWYFSLHKGYFFNRQSPFLGSYANQLTFFRFIFTTTVALFFLHCSDIVLFFLFGFPIFLDGVDGFLARKFEQESSLGALLDKTTDAYFVLILSMVLVLYYEVPFWFLLVGWLHYGYELLLEILNWSHLKIPKNPIGKSAAVVLFIGLLSPFLLSRTWFLPIIYLVSCLTTLSFAWSFRAKYHAFVKT